jgi:hypothetical protein
MYKLKIKSVAYEYILEYSADAGRAYKAVGGDLYIGGFHYG